MKRRATRCLLAPPQVVFASLENVAEQIYDPLLQGHRLRRACFHSLDFCILLALGGSSPYCKRKRLVNPGFRTPPQNSNRAPNCKRRGVNPCAEELMMPNV
jgi:hypothetical protein